MNKRGSADDLNRMLARAKAEECRPIDDTTDIRDFPKYGRPLVHVGEIHGKAVAWTASYGLVEWLDEYDNYHVGWARSSSIKRVGEDEWKGTSKL